MGQTLSEPITAKQSESGQNDYLHYGYSSMQGWRLSMIIITVYWYNSINHIAMEDSHCAILNLKAPEKSDKHPSLFAVFDGHGGMYIVILLLLDDVCVLGHKVAVQAAQRIADNLTTLKEYQHGDYPKAMVQAFLELDEELKRGILSDVLCVIYFLF